MKNKIQKAWRSKTIWFNAVIATALAVLPEAFDQLQVALPTLHDYLPENAYKTIALTAVVGNIILRSVTRLPLEAK